MNELEVRFGENLPHVFLVKGYQDCYVQVCSVTRPNVGLLPVVDFNIEDRAGRGVLTLNEFWHGKPISVRLLPLDRGPYYTLKDAEGRYFTLAKSGWVTTHHPRAAKIYTQVGYLGADVDFSKELKAHVMPMKFEQGEHGLWEPIDNPLDLEQMDDTDEEIARGI